MALVKHARCWRWWHGPRARGDRLEQAPLSQGSGRRHVYPPAVPLGSCQLGAELKPRRESCLVARGSYRALPWCRGRRLQTFHLCVLGLCLASALGHSVRRGPRGVRGTSGARRQRSEEGFSHRVEASRGGSGVKTRRGCHLCCGFPGYIPADFDGARARGGRLIGVPAPVVRFLPSLGGSGARAVGSIRR